MIREGETSQGSIMRATLKMAARATTSTPSTMNGQVGYFNRTAGRLTNVDDVVSSETALRLVHPT